MPDTYTPNYTFTQPEIGGSLNTWGAKLNTNFLSIDRLLGGNDPISPRISGGRILSLTHPVPIEAGGTGAVTATGARSSLGAASSARVISTGTVAATGLTGGGDLTANRNLSLGGQALALHTFTGVGLMVRTSAGSFFGRTITGTAPVSVTNGDGVSGNPAISVAAATTAAQGVVRLATPEEVAGRTSTTAVVTVADAAAIAGDVVSFTLGAVGSFAFLARKSVGAIVAGNTYSGSDLCYAALASEGTFDDDTALDSRAPAIGFGTWRALGATEATGRRAGTLFVRVS